MGRTSVRMPQRGLMIHGILVIAVRAWDWRLNLLNIFHVVLRGHTTQWATKPLVYTVEWDNAEDKAPVKLFGSLSNALDPTTYYGNNCPLTTTRMDPPFSRCWSYTTIAGKKDSRFGLNVETFDVGLVWNCGKQIQDQSWLKWVLFLDWIWS